MENSSPIPVPDSRFSMYTTCLFCHADLGRNEVVEAFPVGRRLAFDAAKGRLWVVCRKCERWNLTPLEERWEAIEDCERRFRDARLRASTDNVGRARLREGLELVRIGAPQRPELAAWRYGDQFGRRRRAMLVRGGVAAAALATVGVGLHAAGIGVFGMWWAGRGIYDTMVNGREDAVVAHIPHEGRQLRVKRKHLRKSAILRDGDGLAVVLRHAGEGAWSEKRLELRGDAAFVAARQLLPQANRRGGSKRDVHEAVGMIERIGDANAAVRELATSDARHADRDRPLGLGDVRRLALEMVLHEEQERRALEGELAMLETAWRAAEEVAAIADGMFVDDGVASRLEALRRGR